jgi:hypothetical protein
VRTKSTLFVKDEALPQSAASFNNIERFVLSLIQCSELTPITS